MTYNTAGQFVDPVHAYKPVLASGVAITTDGTANTNATQAVVAGKRYSITKVTATVVVSLGFATTATAANIVFVLTDAHPTIHFQVPEGVTALAHQSTGTSSVLRMVEIDNG